VIDSDYSATDKKHKPTHSIMIAHGHAVNDIFDALCPFGNGHYGACISVDRLAIKYDFCQLCPRSIDLGSYYAKLSIDFGSLGRVRIRYLGLPT
jgi:hypothetical protein